MKIKDFLFFFTLCFFVSKNYAQEDSLQITTEEVVASQNQAIKEPYDPLAPARAAFYSAVLPGLGQAYNESYWKIPVAYAGIGAGIYAYSRNNKLYHRYRDAYKRRLAGFRDDEFIHENGTELLTTAALIEGQKYYQRYKEISILVIVGVYVLNIVDANVDAHLRQFDVSEDLSLKPAYELDGVSGNNNFGISLNYNF